MKKMTANLKNEKGNVTVVALMVLIILTLIGISASRTSNTDVLVARNQIPHKQDFYIAEGGQNKEAVKIAAGQYPVTDIETADQELADSTGEISTGNSYEYRVNYEGHYPPPKGYSTLHYKRYDYEVETKGGDSEVTITARYYSVGPKEE